MEEIICSRRKGTGRVECVSIKQVMRERREAMGLCLRSVSDQSGVSHSTISRIENGKAVDWETMVKLAKFYSLKLDDLATLPFDDIPEAAPGYG